MNSVIYLRYVKLIETCLSVPEMYYITAISGAHSIRRSIECVTRTLRGETHNQNCIQSLTMLWLPAVLSTTTDFSQLLNGKVGSCWPS